MADVLDASTVPLVQLPTNLRSDRHGVHRWYNFIAGFSPEYVSKCIESAPNAYDGFLLDPFAGTGTSLIQAQVDGLQSVGYEVQPFFAEIARAKCHVGYEAHHIEAVKSMVYRSIEEQREPDSVWSVKQLEYLRKLVPEESLSFLSLCPVQADSIDGPLRFLFRLVVSRVLEHASFSQTDGIYKAPTSRKIPAPVSVALERVCASVLADIFLDTRRHSAEVIEASSRRELRGGASICVTSPPYLNNFDFAEMSRMEIYFWKWADDWGAITRSVRSIQLPNTTTVPVSSKQKPSEIAHLLPPKTRQATLDLHQNVKDACRGRSKDYHRLVVPYMVGLTEVIQGVRRALQRDAPFHMIVADSAFYGIHVPLHEFVSLIFEEVGFLNVDVIHLRERGHRWTLEKRKNPPSKMGEYWISGTRSHDDG